MKLGDACERYWAEVSERQSSARTTRYQLDRLIRDLGGDTRLDQIAGDAVANYITERRQQPSRRGGTVGPASINREIELLRRVMNRAERVWGADTTKLEWGLLRLKEPPPRQRVLSADEEARLVAAAAGHLKAPIRFALLTGLRLDNVMRLDWRQIDLVEGFMSFTAKGDRLHVLPVTPSVRDLLESVGPQAGGPVFTYRGRPVRSWKTAWHGALKRAGIEDFRWHDLRHTVGSRLVQRGVDISAVQDVMGHADIETTRRYVHHNTVRKVAALSLLEGEPGEKPGPHPAGC